LAKHLIYEKEKILNEIKDEKKEEKQRFL